MLNIIDTLKKIFKKKGDKKMTIYKLDLNGIRNSIKMFNKTIYGKTVFVLAYAIPLMIIITMLSVIFSAIICGINYIFVIAILMLGILLSFIFFITGTRYYYRELKQFIKEQ